MKDLWVEKYRPKTVDGYVFRDEAQRSQVKTWIKDKSISKCTGGTTWCDGRISHNCTFHSYL